MSTITTHVLDTALGRPAAGIRVTLEGTDSEGASRVIGTDVTDAEGRSRALLPEGTRTGPGEYRLRFETGAYFAASGREAFYPVVSVSFVVTAGGGHYHVPLLLSPFGYSTYRGS
jgi:5-hydroxyisourate hydrolase